MKKLFFTLITLICSGALAGWFGNAKPKDVCNTIVKKSVEVAIACDRFISDKANVFDGDYVDWCLTVGELSKKVTSSSPEDAFTCIQAIANKKLTSIPETQIEVCEKLKNSNNSRYVLSCIAHEHAPGLMEICKKPFQISGDFENVGRCLAASWKYESSDTEEIEEAKKCFSEQTKGPMKVNSWKEIIACIDEHAPTDSSGRGASGAVRSGSTR